jgi:hypothetical protein
MAFRDIRPPRPVGCESPAGVLVDTPAGRPAGSAGSLTGTPTGDRIGARAHVFAQGREVGHA